MVHQFSSYIATHYGRNAALVYSYFAYRAAQQDNTKVRISSRDLAERYSYLSYSTLQRALDDLCRGTRKYPALLRRLLSEGDQTYTYIVESPDSVTSDILHKFDSDMALKHGITAALICYNVGFWIRSNWKAAAEAMIEKLDPDFYMENPNLMTYDGFRLTRNRACHFVSPKHWAKAHPYVSQRTAERTFKSLVDEGILRRIDNEGAAPGWTLSNAELEAVCRTYRDYDPDIGYDKMHQVDLKSTGKSLKTIGVKEIDAKMHQAPPKCTRLRQNAPGLRQNAPAQNAQHYADQVVTHQNRPVINHIKETKVKETKVKETITSAACEASERPVELFFFSDSSEQRYQSSLRKQQTDFLHQRDSERPDTAATQRSRSSVRIKEAMLARMHS